MAKKYPFFASLLTFDRFLVDERVPTVAVSLREGKVCYPYNPRFIRACDLEHLMGVLHHEVNHVIFGHVFEDRKNYADPRARTVAAEVTVNEWVPEPLPGKPLKVDDFPDLPPGEDTNARYKRLAGQCGLPNHVCMFDGVSEKELREAGLEEQRRILQSRRAMRELMANRSDAGLALPWLEDRVGVEELGSTSTPATPIPWSRLLRNVRGRSVRQQPTFSERPRRLPHLTGVVPADTIQPSKPKVLAVIDTSGSMNPLELKRVAAELKRIGRLCDVVVVECDVAIRAKYKFQRKVRRVRGRGRTDLRPAFEAEFLRETQPYLVVYFTDGHGPAPEHAPRVPVIWCLTKQGTPPVLWGRIVRMPA
jgi:predicted metal-dependent peptidase